MINNVNNDNTVNNMRRTSSEHYNALESRFGEFISCVCDHRIKLLIDFGVYYIENPEESKLSVYSCRTCQYNRMMQNPEYTCRL